MTLHDFIAQWEGCRLKAYDCEPDVPGVDTIGYGHLLTPQEHDTGYIIITGQKCRWEDGISMDMAKSLFAQDLQPVVRCVRRWITVPITSDQLTACVSFAYNCGLGAFRRWLLPFILKQNTEGLLAEWSHFTKNNGVELLGLVKRRAAEIALWRGSTQTTEDT